MQKYVLKEKFYISSTSLQELEHIKVSRNKEEQVKYAARKILHILDENESSYNVIVTDSKIIDIINQHGLENTPDNQIFPSMWLQTRLVGNQATLQERQ